MQKYLKKIRQFCTIFGLKQIVKSPTPITCRNTSLTDYILASIPSWISQHSAINVSVSDHQLIYCTRKINKIKAGGVHKLISYHSFKKYTVDAYKDALKKVSFPNCELFNDANEVYSNFFQNIRSVIDNIPPCETERVKVSTKKWFDGEVLENIETNFLKDLGNLDFILIENCTKKQNTIH